MRPAGSTERRADVSEQLQSARDLLGQGRAGEAQQVIEAALEHQAGFGVQDAARCCGLLGRLLALRGEPVRAALMAELAVQLARAGPAGACQAVAYLDRAHTLRTLGDRDEALACLRRARELAPRDVPAGAF